jgi:DNA topoisomerase I
MEGRYGPYVKWDKVNATLPKGMAPEAVNLDEALALIAERAASGKKKVPARKAAKPAAKAAGTAPAKKAPTKKALAKKAVAKKASTKAPAAKAARTAP